MMTGADPDPLSLPDAPPPAPARREAAIEAALRRFDGGAPAPAKPRRDQSGWRPAFSRQHLAAALAISFLGLVIAPLAWMATQPERAYQDAAEPERLQAETAEPAAAPRMAKGAVVPAAPRDQAPPAEAAIAPPPATEARNVAAPAPPALVAPSPPPPAPAMAPAPPPPPANMAAKAVRAESAAQIADADRSAAPAPIARERTGAARAAVPAEAEIVVTSSRRVDDGFALAGRGDWNACTALDPQQDIARCGKQIGMGAKGDKGVAAPHIADGLKAAWSGNGSNAVAAFDRAIAVSPRSSLAWLNRGLAHRMDGDTDRALADLNKAIQYAPGSARAYYNRALVYRDQGNQRRADADRQRAAELDMRYAP